LTLNPECVGRRYRGTPQVIDAVRARAFATAVGSDSGAAGGELARLPSLAAVYLLAPVVALLFADAEVGLDLRRLVHGEQSFALLRPPRDGETLHPEGTIAAAEARRSLEVLRLELLATDADGDAVTAGSSLFVIRGGPRGAHPS